MKTEMHRRRLIRSPRDRRRAGVVVRGGAVLAAGLLALGTAACDGGVKETTTSRVRGIAAGPPAMPPVTPATDPASAPIRVGEGTAGGTHDTVTVPAGPVDWVTAETAWRERRYAEAAALFTAWSGERPGNPWGPYMVGLSLWKDGELSGAEEALRKAVELDGEHRKAHLNLARVLLEAGRPEEALEPALRATELEPASPEAWRVLGRVHHERGSVDEAVGAYRTALFLDRDDAWSLNNLGLLHIQGGRFEEALGPLARAVEADSTLGVAQNNLGIALERTGRHGQAAEAYRSAIDLGEGDRASVSLARVEGRADQEGVEPVTLTVLARRFETSLEEPVAPTPVAANPRDP